MPGHHLLVGFGVTNQAVCRALAERGVTVIATDDRASTDTVAAAGALGVELVTAPDEHRLRELITAAELVIPTPGLPDHHPAMRLVRELGAETASEFDLAAAWDHRPIAAVTGTNGKTTVTTLVADMLGESGMCATLAGNNDTPLVEAITDPRTQLFVVEASSFRLGHSRSFAPLVATWLNFAPDHLDVHADLAAYEAAKAALFRFQPVDGVAITNADDPVVARYTGSGPARPLTFGLVTGQYRVHAGQLLTDRDEPIVPIADLPKQAPHDLDNALAAAATAISAGATVAAVAEVLVRFEGLAHRVELVGEVDRVRYLDDSKATVPHATLTALRGLDRVVLIAGGRNKGLDLGVLAEAADRLAGVVAIGEATEAIVAAFVGTDVPTRRAASMDEAVGLASSLASPGSTVLLSPACASHDWYANYAERGDDFARAVRALGDRASRT